MQLGHNIDIETDSFYRLCHDQTVLVQLSESAPGQVEKSAQLLNNLIENQAELYGITTGFGPLVKYSSGGHENSYQHGQGLLNHLTTGIGQPVPAAVVRGAIINRVHTLAMGKSGVRSSFLDWLIANVNAGVQPHVPQVGSLGASGDLVPMAHTLHGLSGQGSLLTGSSEPVSEFSPTARECLGFVNGIPMSTSYAIHAVEEALIIFEEHLKLIGAIYDILGANTEHISYFLNEAKLHPGQRYVASKLRHRVTGQGQASRKKRPLQEVYSIRCVPQIMGAIYDSLQQARNTLYHELNSVDDNPVFGEDTAFHGGNFFGQHVAFAADQVNSAGTQLAILAERQLADMLEPEISDSEPMLTSHVGPNSGMAGLQIVATAAIAEMRSNANMHSVFSIPTNGRNQDIVPMAMLAARKAHDNAQLAGKVVAALGLALKQYEYVEKVDGMLPGWLEHFKGFDNDISLGPALNKAASQLLGRVSVAF